MESRSLSREHTDGAASYWAAAFASPAPGAGIWIDDNPSLVDSRSFDQAGFHAHQAARSLIPRQAQAVIDARQAELELVRADELERTRGADLGAQVWAAGIERTSSLARDQVRCADRCPTAFQESRPKTAGRADSRAFLAHNAGAQELFLRQCARRTDQALRPVEPGQG
jgi:hypothetical protein